MSQLVCIPKSLTPSQAELALKRSLEINPSNAIESRMVERTPRGLPHGPRRLALLIRSRWPATGVTLPVQFLDNPTRELRRRILLHMNAWSKTANIHFEETQDTGMVRISRLDRPDSMAGYWSYVGTQILAIDDDQPTLNLDGFTMRTAESEFKRVVRHEAGHTLGFEHEHMRADLIKKINRQKCIAFYRRDQGWTEQETIEQVLTPLSVKSIMGTTEADPLSIMCYEIPGKITIDGKPIRGGTDINPKDYAFAGQVYPKTKSHSPAAFVPNPISNVANVTPLPSLETPQQESIYRQDTDTFHIVIMDGFDGSVGSGPDDVAAKTDIKRPKFARVFASYGGARVTSAMRLRADAGGTTRYGKIIGMHERIKNFTNRERGTLPSDAELIEFGSDLFETVFQGDVRRLYDEARARQQNRKLDVVFTSMIPWIAEKPWEFSYDTVRKSFLATEEIHFVRNVLTAVPSYLTSPKAGPLRILVVSAQPVGYGKLSIAQETEVIRRGFLSLEDAGLVKVDVLVRARPRQVLEYLSTGIFTVVHFIGHGNFDESNEQGTLIFENERGEPIELNERSVREIFGKRGINLVFLNACLSGSGGRHHFNKGVAQSLVAHGLPAAVANQYSVLDTSATSFAQHFYWALAHGMSIGQATCEARIAVNCSMQGELIDWAVPVVYSRDPNLTLRIKPDQIHPMPTAIPGTNRRAAKDRSVRIAVWDIDNVFPELDDTLESMNLSQSAFGFDLVTLSTPIDAWYLDQKADDGSPYLWAEKLARRLGQIPAELDVNFLLCITRHSMCDDKTLDLYGWWPDADDRKQHPIMIFSCAGFEDLAPAGFETNRAIANVTVSMLAGMLAAMGSHDRGAKNCPFFYNGDRDLNYLINHQKFDQNCRAKLKQRLPAEQLTALDELLKTFS